MTTKSQTLNIFEIISIYFYQVVLNKYDLDG